MSSHLHRQKAIIVYLIAATISTLSPAQSQGLGQLEIRREATESTSKIKIQDEMSLREAIRLANRLALMGETAEASAIWEKAVKWGEKNLGNEHPDLATGLINLANLYRDLERYPEAERLLERAAEIDKKNYGPQSLERAGSLTSLAMTLLDQDKLEAARQTQAEALDIYRHTLGTNHHYTSVALNNLGLIYKEDGQLDTAERLLKQSLQASTKNEPESKGLAVATLGTLATIYIRKAQYS